MKPQIIVALDLPSSENIHRIIHSLPTEILYYKIGLELFASEGPRCLDSLTQVNKKIFLDLKLHDIPRTVSRAISAAARHGASLLTVHAAGGRAMLQAAAEAANDADAKLLAVTTLTSLDQHDLAELGVSRPLSEHTQALGELAIASGIHGLVCSVHEAPSFRKHLGDSPLIITPGIRPFGSEVADQKRVATPTLAVKSGANFLVVGRPILDAFDPSAAARSILDEINQAASSD